MDPVGRVLEEGSSTPSAFVRAEFWAPRRSTPSDASDASDASAAASSAASDVSSPSFGVAFGVSSAARSGAPRFSRTNGGNTVGADDVAMPASH